MKVIQVKAPFIINAIDGNAFALTTDGQQQLTKGDTVKLGQILITDNNCQITVDFNGHNHQLLSSNQSLNFDEQLSQPRIIHLLLEQPNLELQVSHTNHFDIIDALNSENDGSTAVKQDQTQVNTEFVNVFSQVIASAGHDTEYQTTAWKQVYEYLFTTTVNNDPSSSINACINIDNITADNIINANEAKGNITVQGTVGDDVKLGDTVIITIDSIQYVTKVAEGDRWSIDVAGQLLVDNVDHKIKASVVTKDSFGHSATANAEHAYMVDTTIAASITIDHITSDDVINAAEAKTNIPVHGSVGDDVKVGDTVTVHVGDKTYTTTVQIGKTWTVDVPGKVLVDNGSHNVHASVTATDIAGNSATANADHAYTVDTTIAASITIESITSDDVINAAEAKTNIPVNGTVGDDAKVGDTVTVNVGDKSYTTAVQAGNTWTVDVPGQVLVDNGSHNVHASVSTTDTAGNSATANADHAYTVDTSIAASITIDNITSDDVINAAEAKTNIPVHGTVGDDATVGDTVTVNVGDNSYTTTVQAGNTWSIAVPGQVLVDNGSHNVHASVSTTDTAGNSAMANADHAYTVDTSIAASIVIDNITSDDVINAAEAKINIPLHGSVGDDVKDGDTVTVHVGDKTYTTTVQAGNTWTVDVPGQVLVDNGSHNVHASVSTTDNAGNSATANADHAYTVDTTIAASITIDNITSDDVINAVEAKTNIPVHGTVGDDAKVGDTVTVNVGDKSYTTTVQAGNTWTVDVPGQVLVDNGSHNVHASVSTTDNAGNSATANADHAYTVDTTIAASITIDNVTSDNVINESEATQQIQLSGSVGGDVKLGDIVTVNVAGQNLTTKVIDKAGKLSWELTVAGSLLAHAAIDNITALVTATDKVGNSITAHSEHVYKVAVLDVVVTIDAINNGKPITGIEHDNNTVIDVNGHVSGNAKIGDVVTLHFGNKTFETKVIEIAGNQLGYSAKVPAGYFVPNSNNGFTGNVEASITIHDEYQNIASAHADKNYSADGVVIVDTPSSNIIYGSGYNDVLVGDSLVVQPKIDVNLVLDTSGSMANPVIDANMIHLNKGFTSGEIVTLNASGQYESYLQFSNMEQLAHYYEGTGSTTFLKKVIQYYGLIRLPDGSLQQLTYDDLHTSSRIEQAKQSILEIAHHYGEVLDHQQLSDMKFSLITFAVKVDNNVQFHWDFDRKAFINNSGNSLDTVLDKVIAWGATNDFNTALAAGINSFSDSHSQNVIYFVSDGLDGSTNLNTIKHLVGDNLTKFDPIIIPTLIGSDVSDIIPQEVKDLASLGDGYTSNNDGDSKVIIVKDITKLGGELNNSFDNIISGNDTIHGSNGNDIIVGDTLNNEWLMQQYGSDISHLQDKIDSGTSIKDILYDVVAKANGVEVKQLTTENVYQYMQDNQQHLVIDATNDINSGVDKLFGDGGNDVIFGSGGNDTLTGGFGNDLLFGLNGDDILVSDVGSDILWGGDGIDIFKLDVLNVEEKSVTIINDLGSQDKIDLSSILDDDKSIDNILKHISLATIDDKDVILTINDNNVTHQVELKNVVDIYSNLGNSTSDIVTSLFEHNVFNID